MKRALEEHECHIQRKKTLTLKEIRLQHYVSVYLTHYSPSIALTIHLLRQEVYTDVMRSIHCIMFYHQFNNIDLTQTSIIGTQGNYVMRLSEEKTLSYVGTICEQLYRPGMHKIWKEIHEMNNITLDIVCGTQSVILLTTRGLFGIGCNKYGQLGFSKRINEKPTIYTDKPKSININEDVKNIISIHCSESCTSILTVNGLYVFGSNRHGQLGLPLTIENKDTPCILNLNDDFYGGKQKILSVSCGDGFMILKTCNGLYLCGSIEGCRYSLNDNYQAHVVGRSLSESTKIIYISSNHNDIGNTKSISCGACHVLMLTDKGLYGLGFNFDGQLATKRVHYSTSFMKLSIPSYLNTSHIKSIHCGFNTSFILTNDGLLYASGLNGRGQLGLGDLNDRFEFTRVPIDNVISVHLPLNSSYSIITTHEGVFECGSNEYRVLRYNDDNIIGINSTSLFTKIDHI